MKVQATPLCCAQPSTAGLALYLMLLFFFFFLLKFPFFVLPAPTKDLKKNNKKNVKFNFVIIIF